MSLKPQQTIFIAIQQGFASRYLLRTDIFTTLKDSGAKIVILSPNTAEEYFVKEFAGENVFVEPLRIEEYRTYSERKLQRFLRQIRWYVMNEEMDLYTIDMRY
ncbi:MAG: hypothetical protein JSW40_01945, partial [Candidatus Omnitrophota bacterium]